MAYFEKLWIHEGDIGKAQMTLHVKLKPSGEAQVKVPVPKPLWDALIGIAQTAADAHEAQMRAAIVGETYLEDNPTTPKEQ